MNHLSIDKREVLRYLGYRDQDIDSRINLLIDEGIDEIRVLVKPRYIYKLFDIDRDNEKIYLEQCTLELEGKGIARHLKNAQSCILMAVTLGNDIDTKIRYYETIDMTKALIMDACATAAVEEISDNLCHKIEKKLRHQGKKLTYRYSPGYEDLSLDIQREFISVLRADRAIGLNVSSHSILIPRKSITAIAGVIDKSQFTRQRDCLNCSKFSHCEFRKECDICGR